MNRNSGDYEDVLLHDTTRRTQYYLLYLKGLKAEDCSDSTPWRQLRVTASSDGPSATSAWAREEPDLSRPPMPSGASGTLALWEDSLELLVPEQLLEREFKVEVLSKGALGRATVLAEGVFCPRNELLLPNALPIYIQVELYNQNVSTKRVTAKGSAQITAVLEKSLEKLESIVPVPATVRVPATVQRIKQEDQGKVKKSGPAMIMATPPPPPPPFQDPSEEATLAGASSSQKGGFRDGEISASSKYRLSMRQRLSMGIKSVQRMMSLSPTRLLGGAPPPPNPSPNPSPGSRRNSGEYDEDDFLAASGSSRAPPPPPQAPSRQGSARLGNADVSKESLLQDNEVLRLELNRANKELDDAIAECSRVSNQWEHIRDAMAVYKDEIDEEKLQMQSQLDDLQRALALAKGQVGDKRAQSERIGRELGRGGEGDGGSDAVIDRLRQQLQEAQTARGEELTSVRQLMEEQKREFDREKLDLCSKILLRSRGSQPRRQSVFSQGTAEPRSSSSSSSSLSPSRRRSVAVAHEEVNKDELELWMFKYVEMSHRLDAAKRQLAAARQSPLAPAPHDLDSSWEGASSGAGDGLQGGDTCAAEEAFPEYSDAVLSVDEDIVYESISVQAQLAAALDDDEAMVTMALVHMASISKDVKALADRNLADGQGGEFMRLTNFCRAMERLLSDSQLLADVCPAFALSPQLQGEGGSDSTAGRTSRLSRLQNLLQRSLSLVARIETALGMSFGASPQGQELDGQQRISSSRRSSDIRSSMRLSRRYSSPFRDDIEEGSALVESAADGHSHSHSHTHGATLNEKLALIYNDLQPMTDTLRELLRESPYLSPEAHQRARLDGTRFLTSTYFFNTANATDGHSIASLLIKSNFLPVTQAIFKNWPDLQLSGERSISSSPGDATASAAKIDMDGTTVDFSNPKSLRDLGFTLAQIKQSGRFSERDFLSFGLSAKELKSIGFDAVKLRKAGYSVIDCFKAGFNAQQLRKGGFDETLAVKSGRFAPEQLHHAGFDVQRHALVALFEALDGTHWRNKHNWCSARPLAEWHGVHLSGAGLVLRLDLRSNYLCGDLPASIAMLTSLEYLDLGNNDLRGELPTAALSKLTRLRDLWLTNNPRLCVRPAAKPALRAAMPKCVLRIDVNNDLPNMLQE